MDMKRYKIIYTEKLPYLQRSSQYLIQREIHGYPSYDTVYTV